MIEILNLNRELISNFQKAGVRLDDVRYIDLYNEYRTLAAKGEKTATRWSSMPRSTTAHTTPT